MQVLAFAKINLTLDVRRRRADGYHEIDSLVQTIDLADRITVSRCGRGVFVDNDLVGLRGRDLAEVAAERLLAAKGVDGGLRVRVEKRIPAGAGLGGGSSDAAAVLAAGDRLIPPRLSQRVLLAVASEIGSDVPLFLLGGRVRMTGRGEIVTRAGAALRERFVVLVPPIHCETAEVYRRFSAVQRREGRRSAGENALLAPALAAYPTLARYHEAIGIPGAERAGMSGSGSSFFAAFQDASASAVAAERLRERFPEARVFVCSSTTAGHRIIEEEAG